MAIAERYKEYLTKAEEAELQAAKATGETARATWLRIAAGYRDLAKMAQRGHGKYHWPL